MAFKKGNIPWNKDKPHTEVTKKKLRENHWTKNEKIKDDVMQRMIKSKNEFYKTDKGKKLKKSLSELNKGENNPHYGKPRSEKTKEKISKANSGENNGMYGKKPWNKNKKWPEIKEWLGEYEFKKGNKSWNDGLSMAIDERVKNNVESMKKTRNTKKWKETAGKEMGLKISKANSGENGPNWQGGISFEPYGPEFNKRLKQKIKERDDYTCQLCGNRILVFSKKRHLTVHHINYNKKDSKDKNLITLCNFCNISVNKDREDWTNYFQEKINQIISANADVGAINDIV